MKENAPRRLFVCRALAKNAGPSLLIERTALSAGEFFAGDRTDELAGTITSSGADRETVGGDRDAQDEQQPNRPENLAFHDETSFAKDIW